MPPPDDTLPDGPLAPHAGRDGLVAGVVQAAVGLSVVWATRTELAASGEADGLDLLSQAFVCDLPQLYLDRAHVAWPWGFPWLVSHVAPWAGDAQLGGRLVSALASAVLVGAVLITVRHLGGSRRDGWLAALLVGTSPLLLNDGTLAESDALAAALLTAAVAAATRLSARPTRSTVAFAAALAAAATQVRYQAFVPAALLLLLLPALSSTRRVAVAAVGLGVATLLLEATTLLPWRAAADLWGLRQAAVAATLASDGGLPSLTPSLLATRLAWSTGFTASVFGPLVVLAAAWPLVRTRVPPRTTRVAVLAVTLAAWLVVAWFLRNAQLRRLLLPVLPLLVVGAVGVRASVAGRARVVVDVLLVVQLVRQLLVSGAELQVSHHLQGHEVVAARTTSSAPRPDLTPLRSALADLGCALVVTDHREAALAAQLAWVVPTDGRVPLDARVLGDMLALVRQSLPLGAVVVHTPAALTDGQVVGRFTLRQRPTAEGWARFDLVVTEP